MRNKSKQQLIEKRQRLLEKINDKQFLIRGSLVRSKKKCGRKTCRCEKKGELHPHTYLSTTHKRKVRTAYIKLSEIDKVEQAIKAYREVKSLIDEISRVNLALLKQEEEDEHQ